MSSTQTVERFTVNIPSDCSNEPEERYRLAFIAAEEEATTYRIPCEWAIESDDGENIVVLRYSLSRNS